jgi:hypothetical protein
MLSVFVDLESCQSALLLVVLSCKRLDLEAIQAAFERFVEHESIIVLDLLGLQHGDSQ